MALIDRYLLKQLVGPTILATLALTAVALLSQSLAALDIIVSQRQTALIFGKITLLAMPQLINIVLPIALFVAALVALNRLHTEQEIVVCFAGGMSRGRVIAPAMRLASVVALIALVMNLWVQPAASREMRRTVFDVRTDLASTLVREGEFTEPAPGLTVYAQSVESGGRMRNLFIHQEKADGGATTYTADEGQMATRAGKPVLVLRKGSTQEFSREGVLQFLAFQEYVFDLGPLSETTELVHYKPSDRYLHELFFPDLTQIWEQNNRLDLLAEGHRRLATPLYNLAFMSLALWAIIGGGFSRLGYGRRIAIGSATAGGVRILGFIVEAGCESEAWLNIFQYLIPLGTMLVALRAQFRQRPSRYIDIRKRRARVVGAATA
ncbi:MAG: LPS export ABC transporter permease LptF [Phenylobacterium sp.]|jgi:lipopolysaccharide export system permease protein|uniref:LPS export ABC transporter permease LptF n=1 Tax=Phenylobacterium sp. TaxID=1871053 RepID=UPI002A365DE6|nr:LPS export ABC transporter permease LptF [Phenylobacterium sp.]MDX9997608.1 LPS export ABC transporter permease LptF [Phenylobacterium sp.]